MSERKGGAVSENVTLSDLTRDHWTVVARRVRVTTERDGWQWELPPRQVSVFHIAKAHGSVITGQRREGDEMVLEAKLARRPPIEGEAFAVAGMGMFER